ncbi:MAG: YcaO-like family protein [Deltaproteobacteria bacterium]|nr:YcaO-like family protein [Deltaproteobacteria bacterium]
MNHKIILKDAFKGYVFDQDKTCLPSETVRRFREKLKKVNLDILERTIRIDNGRLGIPVFFSLCGQLAEDVIGTKKQMGKGGRPEQAEASAVMELAERFSFFSFCKNQNNFFIEQYINIKDRAIDFQDIAKSVHDSSYDLELAEKIFSRLPLKWVYGYNMTKAKEVLIPFNWFYAINEFNGPSAGNCVEEALLQGICEVVERHVSSIVSRNRIATREINIDSLTDPLTVELIGKYKKAGIRLFIKDFSLDIGIPSVGVLAYDPSTFPEKSEIVWTAGTAPDPQKALIRALTEVAQLAGDFNSGSKYIASGLPKFGGLDEADYVTGSGPSVDITRLPDLSDDNIRVEVENCISAISHSGMDVMIINTTHEKLDIPSFYTIIPGAQFRGRAANSSVGMFTAKLISENGDAQRAIRGLIEMDKTMPGKYYVKFFLGVSHLAIGEKEKALRYLEHALTLGPNQEDLMSIYFYMGTCLKELDRFKDALSVLENILHYDAGRTEVYNLMGFCYFKLKEHEKAIECFQKVLKLDPSSAIDYANIASNYRDIGDIEKAAHYYELALELDGTLDFARDNLMALKIS